MKPPSDVRTIPPQGRVIPNANLNKGKKAATSDGPAPAPLGTKVSSQNWRKVGTAGPSMDSGPSETPASMQGMALLVSSNIKSGAEAPLLASVLSPGTGSLDAHASLQAMQPSVNDNSGGPVSTPVIAPSSEAGISDVPVPVLSMVQPMFPPGLDPAHVDPIVNMPGVSVQDPLCIESSQASQNMDTTGPVIVVQDDPAPAAPPTSGVSTPPPGGSTPGGIQEPPGLLTVLDKPAGSPSVASGVRMVFSQAASPAIVHQSSVVTRGKIVDSSTDTGPLAAVQAVSDCPTASPELENSENMALDLDDGDTVVSSEGDEPPGGPVTAPGKPFVQVLMAPGWDAPSRLTDFMAVHSNFVGKASSQSARPEGLPPRTGLRRSASVPSQPNASK